jgi:Fur family ferric uptake transcriptional regulator
MPIQSLDRDVEKRLNDRDVRYTRGRRKVVAALHEADGPMSAAELHDKVSVDVPLSSLYRTLAVLEAAEVVMPHFGTRGITRYELAEWLTGHHHHLVCVVCGTVDDIDVPPRYEEAVRVLVDKIAGVGSFSPSGHVLEIEGRCSKCR